MIEVKEFTKVIRKKTILDKVSCTFEDGLIYGLSGINGSGKTMLMRAISGLILPTSGEVVINGKVLGKDMSFPDSMGILIETPSFIDYYTGKQNLALLASINRTITEAEIDAVLRKVGLEPEDKRKYRKYSLGMKQRLGIASAIMENPRTVILDEPFSALDESGVVIIRGIIGELKAKGVTVILSCHDRQELESITDIIYKITEGRLERQA